MKLCAKLWLLCMSLLLLALPAILQAERLPIKSYTTVDRLPHYSLLPDMVACNSSRHVAAFSGFPQSL